MNGWQTVSLEECCEIVSGGTPSTSVDNYWNGDICWATPKDLSDLGGSTFISDTPRKLTRAGLEACAASILPAGSVLFSSRAPIGHVALNTIPMATNQGFKSFVPKAGRVDAKFLYWWLRSNRPYLEGLGNGATFKEVSKSTVARIEIPVPHLAEQRRIAAILDKADELRAKRRVAISRLDKLTQSIFLDLFGDPKTNPKGWPHQTMAELFAAPPIFGSMIPPVSEHRGWLSLRVANIQNWNLDLRDRKYIYLPPKTVERHSVRDGDLLLARAIASEEHLGKCVVVQPGTERWAFDSHLMRLRFDQKQAKPEFIRHLLMTPGGRSLFLRASRKSTVQFNINTKEMSALKIPVPPNVMQSEFVRHVAAVETLKAIHDVSLAKLDALFASLQHRAFRGEL